MSIYTTCDGPGLCIASNMGLTDSLVPVLMLPISRPQGDMTEEELAAAAGCDLVEDLPSLLPWLTENAFKFKKVTVGCYVYMDGEAHVRAAVAMDLIVTGLVASGKGKGVEVSVAYLGSPATCYPIPTECHAAMAQARSDAPFWHHMVMPKPNAAEMDGDFCVFNGLSVLQGPNYALAKTMQVRSPATPTRKITSVRAHACERGLVGESEWATPTPVRNPNTTRPSRRQPSGLWLCARARMRWCMSLWLRWCYQQATQCGAACAERNGAL